MSVQPLSPEEIDDFLRELDELDASCWYELEDLEELLGPDIAPTGGETLA